MKKTKKTKKSKPHSDTGMMVPITFFLLLVVNGAVIYLANLFFPEQVVLGTAFLSPLAAIILSMGVLSLFNTLVVPFVRECENMQEKLIQDRDWMLFYLVANFVGVWVISRFAKQLGLGVSSWMVVAVLAVVLDVAQGVAMMLLHKKKA